MEKKVVVVGDVHGCIDELNLMIKLIAYNPDDTRLIFLGDLMDRGPDSAACVRRVRELGAECIMGNHEEKHLRWHKHEMNRLATGKKNPMKPMDENDLKAHAQLSEDDLRWMALLPLKLHIGGNYWAVHAGCEPRWALDRQNPAQIMRVRYVDSRGTGKALNPDKSQPEGTQYWDEQWKGPESIVYGHCVHNLENPRITKVSDEVECVGVDTGCVFGGELTAATFYKGQRLETFYQVKAAKKYYAGYGED